MTEQEWEGVVSATLADHPEWAAITVAAVQSGVLSALDRQRERVVTLSLGLVAALSTSRSAKSRRRDHIVAAIRASTVHPTIWSAAMIEKEKNEG